jgi:RES domain-containing protein
MLVKPGTRLAYASEHQSLAMLEYFVHLDPEDVPEDLVLATADVPEGVSRKRTPAVELPASWRETPGPPELAQIGDEFVNRAETCLLLVPSALAVSENNWLINPQHPQFKQIELIVPESLRYDAPMFRRSRTRLKPPKS